MNRLAPPPVVLFLLLLATLVAAGRAAGAPQTVQAEVWAQSVVSFKPGPGQVGASFSDPLNALGAVDAYLVALGNAQAASAPPEDPAACEASLVLSFGEDSLVDGPGDDLTIYESALGGLLEPTWVYVGGAQTGWRFVGTSPGGKASLDLNGVAGPGESFSQVALCDVPDGDTTIWPAPGPDIDAVAATNSARIGLVARAGGPGWSVDQDPAPAARQAFLPMPVLADLSVQPRAIFRFECLPGQELDECTSFLQIRARCEGDLAVTNPLFLFFPLPQPQLRDLIGAYETIATDSYFGYCEDANGRLARTAPDPIATFALQEGGARVEGQDPAWRFTLETPVAAIDSAGLNRYTVVHDPALGSSTIQVLAGGVEIAPAAAGAPPFPLGAGQRVVVTADGPGPVEDLAQLFLPVTIR